MARIGVVSPNWRCVMVFEFITAMFPGGAKRGWILSALALAACAATPGPEPGAAPGLEQGPGEERPSGQGPAGASFSGFNVVGPGDILQVAFYMSGARDADVYRIQPGDILSVTVLDHENLSREEVLVLPDGRISVPGAQSVVASGRSTSELAEELRGAYRDLKILDPKVTVAILQADRRTQALLQSSLGLGVRELNIAIDSSGYINLPFIEPVEVGRSLGEIQDEIRQAYRHAFNGRIEVTVNLRSRTAPRVFVLGEVANAGGVEYSNPMSPVMALAEAGGFIDTANRRDIRIFRPRRDGSFSVMRVNLGKEMNDAAGVSQALSLRPNDVLYVPKSGVAVANLFIEQYIRRMIPFDAGLGLVYPLD